jgi:hypothetical protein
MKVAADINNTSGEGCQCILVNALTRTPVHLGQRPVTEPDNDVLRPFVADIIARDADNCIIAGELHKDIL